MKLAILTAQISPYHDARFRSAVERFDEVCVISSRNEGDFKEFLANSLGGYSVVKLYENRAAYDAGTACPDILLRTRGALADAQPDVIAVAGWTAPESLAALEYARNVSIPIVVMSESQIDDAKRTHLREQVKRRVVQQFDAALVGGKTHADYVAKLGIPADRIHMGYNAVDNAYFASQAKMARSAAAELRESLGLPAKYMLASARFIAKKNLPNLVEAFGDARRANPSLPELLILGDGPERQAVEHAISRCDLRGQVHLPGFRGYDVLPAYYALSECFLHISKSEQWGLVINEAMASSTPVIATDTCGAARTVIEDGVSGLLTQSDSGAIKEAILRMFDATLDDRRLMGARGAEAIGMWGPERYGNGLHAAALAAREAPRRGRLSVFDRKLIEYLRGKKIRTVS